MTARLRVAFVLGLAAGGTAGHVVALAAGCRAAGLDVSVLAPAPTLALFGPQRASPAGTGIPAGTAAPAVPAASADFETVPVPITDRPRPARDVVALARLRRAFAAWRPDVVHAHGIRAGAFAAVALATLPRRGRPALAVTVHNAPPAGRQARLIYTALERVCARRAQFVWCASADLVARMRDLGAAGAAQFDVPAGQAAPPSAADVAAATSDIGAGGRPVVLAVGRLAPQKGLDVLIAAAACWRERDSRPRTVIAGDGPLAAALRAQASQAGADVVLLGQRQDVAALLAVADVVAVPSRWEARALILQQAMRAGKPVVATRVGGTPDLTGEDGALLVPPDDAGALAAAVEAVLDDPQLAARLGLAARKRSAVFPSEEDAVQAAVTRYALLARHS